MTHYLRRNGKTIVDVDATKNDVRSVVCIEQYSLFLLEESNQSEIIKDFDALQELRGEYNETNYQKETPDELVGRRLQEIAFKYELFYVTD
jgi:hypothetical protein